jgi:hypothetical protein
VFFKLVKVLDGSVLRLDTFNHFRFWPSTHLFLIFCSLARFSSACFLALHKAQTRGKQPMQKILQKWMVMVKRS